MGEGQNQKLWTNTSLTEIEKAKLKSLSREREGKEGGQKERFILFVPT